MSYTGRTKKENLDGDILYMYNKQEHFTLHNITTIYIYKQEFIIQAENFPSNFFTYW